MIDRIIPVSPVDAAAHVFRVTSGEIVRVFVQDKAGLGPVEFRAHADGRGFTLAIAPEGQVWVELKYAVVGLGALAALNGLDLSVGSIQVGRLAQAVHYWPPLDDPDPAPSDGNSMQAHAQAEASVSDDEFARVLVAELRGLREDLKRMRLSMFAVANSIVNPYK